MPATHLLRFLTIVAMLLAPFGMIMGSHAAMAMPLSSASTMDPMQEVAPAGHCADLDRGSKDEMSLDIDCMIACSALATAYFEVETHPILTALIDPGPPSGGHSGLHPESDPPPPRFS